MLDVLHELVTKYDTYVMYLDYLTFKNITTWINVNTY